MNIKFLFSVALIILTTNLSANSLLAQDQPSQDDSLSYLYDRYISSGLNYLGNKRYSEAEFEFEKARNLNPRRPESYLNLAIIKIHRYDYQLARELLKQALEIMPENYPEEYIILYNLGLCSYQEKDYLQAAEYFSQCLKLNPDLNQALAGLKLCRQNIPGEPFSSSNNNFQEKYNPPAETAYPQREITADHPVPPSSEAVLSADKLMILASQSFKNNKTEEAISLIEKSLNLNPENPEAHYRLGVIYAYLNNFPEAVTCFEKAIAKAPSLTKAYINLGGVYGKLKDYPKALAVLNQALRLDKNNAKIYYNLGMVHIGMSRKGEAKKYFEKARALCRKNGDALLLQKIPDL
ncbi:MAG: tetratricopeptide repeat protein [Candidatus Omnitrophica bacterium]|nr:tetratricopeptide repeat protein [Candidatus Omnitrophota bacterium]MBU2044211.1 tetratricopeptide repeat protein [Candidatus Omnitrophota bacterium]MBU2251713.1 tetratricopeptide repeat protein [Candidatus Omnitrophota bacterium]MBU2473295.1 tetratricopeptide repeat protein [Candidatus Omnitrophota bacterium]